MPLALMSEPKININESNSGGSQSLPSWEQCREILAADPQLVLVESDPRIEFHVDGRKRQLSLVCEVALDEVSEGELRSLLEQTPGMHFEVQEDAEMTSAVVSVNSEDLFPAFLAYATAVVDRLRDVDVSLANALAESKSELIELLRQVGGLSSEVEIGLFGELWVLLEVADSRDMNFALKAWLGPEAEAHDFRWADKELEVKTTSGAERHHWVSRLDQLTASPGATLELVSIKVRRSGPEGGSSVRDLLKEVIKRLEAAHMSTTPFREHVREKFGIDIDAATQCDQSFELADQPMVVMVDTELPQITREGLDRICEDASGSSRIVEVKYMLNVEGLGSQFDVSHLLDHGLSVDQS